MNIGTMRLKRLNSFAPPNITASQAFDSYTPDKRFTASQPAHCTSAQWHSVRCTCTVYTNDRRWPHDIKAHHWLTVFNEIKHKTGTMHSRCVLVCVCVYVPVRRSVRSPIPFPDNVCHLRHQPTVHRREGKT